MNKVIRKRRSQSEKTISNISGFTLIELLAVSAIITVLVGALIPAVR